MYRIIVYRGKRSRVAKIGTYQDCINWMNRAINPKSQLTGWEIKRVIPISKGDLSHVTLMGSIKKYE